ncbi:unnamed protein product (macronuclear) [Paramecium tetraurelia]|uniref:Transmembrane protein n=1 Tax=Paramecium tetraurelia TaxID=5888 RepID=A0CFV2_PARTE|nr:uncharacterized protein GSPATT00038111001 [Paramecium tetraurelia]CAK69669.1 unnamed protein product [Paramecium tetraurelia]|eukprot:XP_001437066.1 hypothetical protein (macronuclear) [Paramecium tetraurelia strain d4-2]
MSLFHIIKSVLYYLLLPLVFGSTVDISKSQNVLNKSLQGKTCQDKCRDNDDYDRCYIDCKMEKEKPMIQIISITCIVLGLMFILFLIWKRNQVLRLFRCIRNRRTIMMESFLNNAILIKNNSPLLNQLRKVNKLLSQQKNELIFIQNGKLHKEENVQITCKIDEEKQYIQITLLGNDKYGIWSGSGFTIMDFNYQIKIWFLKDYEEQREARISGLWEHLLYQGEYDEEVKIFSGQWHYDGFENDLTYSGTWLLKLI